MGRRWGNRSDRHELDSKAADVVQDCEHSSSSSGSALGKRKQHDTKASLPPRRPVVFLEKGVRHSIVLSVDAPISGHEHSEKVIEYQMFLRAHFFHQIGWSKEKVAAHLGRALGWVSRCWQTPPAEFPRPREIPPYIAEYEQHMLSCRVEPFRPPELKRAYVTDTSGLYQECVQTMPWRQAVFRKRNYETGEVTVTGIASNRQDCSYRGLRTGISRLDKALDRIKQEFNISDPRAYLLNNWYPDGKTSIAPHNHDFWSAILSFGESRVFLLDGQPLLLGDGDLLVFGTQRHSVPKMPEVKEGRVSIAIFWYPERTSVASDCCENCGCLEEVLQQGMDGQMYCESCWHSLQASIGTETIMGDSNALEAEDDILAATLQLSLVEQ